MYKTKLGVSVGIMGALVCFLGYFLGVTSWPFLVVIGLILWKEDNEWLRRLVIKVAIISLFFALIPVAINGIQYIFNILNRMFNTDKVKWPVSLDYYINTIANILEIIVFVLLGFKSLNQKHVKIKPVDDIINKNV